MAEIRQRRPCLWEIAVLGGAQVRSQVLRRRLEPRPFAVLRPAAHPGASRRAGRSDGPRSRGPLEGAARPPPG
eukprot:7064952-Pyramimonas_sp.AAC.1